MSRMPDASYVSSDLEIDGDVKSTGTIVICGRIKGAVSAQTVSVDRGGRLEGTVQAQVVVVGGHLEGTLGCDELRVAEFGEVFGDIAYRRLEVVSGGKLVGPLAIATES